jgi:hypothetical protein
MSSFIKNLTREEYFNPQLPQEWTFKTARRAHALREPFNTFGVNAIIASVAGMIFTAIRVFWVGAKASLSAPFTVIPATSVIAITSAALLALGICLVRFGNRHLQGLTQERAHRIALDQFKKEMSLMPICQSQKELEDRVAHDPKFGCHRTFNLTNKINQVHYLIGSLYHANKELIPHFWIKADKCNAMDSIELLKAAYQKGIILHFSTHGHDLIHMEPRFSKDLRKWREEMTNPEVKHKVELPFIRSFDFLQMCVSQKDSNGLDAAKINAQLEALAWMCVKSEDERVMRYLKPPFYLEDDKTLVIRSYFGELLHHSDYLDSLTQQFDTVKIEKTSMINYALYTKEPNIPKFYLPGILDQEWITLLKSKYNNLVFFLDEESEFQSNPPRLEDGVLFSELLRSRLKKFDKTNRQQPQIAP